MNQNKFFFFKKKNKEVEKALESEDEIARGIKARAFFFFFAGTRGGMKRGGVLKDAEEAKT